jgi:hypothetical protein
MLNSIFEQTTLDQVAGVLKHNEQPKSLDDLEDAIRLGVSAQRHDCRQCERSKSNPKRCRKALMLPEDLK